MRKFLKSAAFPILIVILLVFVAQRLVVSSEPSSPAPTFDQFVTDIGDGRVERATIKVESKEVDVVLKDETKFTTGYPEDYSNTLVNQLEAAKVPFEVKGIPSSPWWSSLIWLAPFILFIGFWIYLMNRMQGGGSKVMSFGKSRAKRMAVDAPKITFKDVAGADEAVEELHEIKEFLENPKKFQALGARIPKGVLLFGPPGTGKTLLARAVAGEAGVPFFSISGSDFVEMFVGVGASRVRDLFEQAKQSSPCIIFMDEIDAVGRHRGAGLGGGHDEREQTLNQLLVEMDGFEAKDNIILIAATNRPDILDPALLRPGRFDRQIVVDRPDRDGRAQILRVHTKGKPIAKAIDLMTLAGQTPGFTGADLANLVNEAALLAARKGKRLIEQAELEEGIMRVIAGPEKKSRLLSEKERVVTAYHEMGHALVGHFLPDADPVHKISVVSRGQALGYTISMPVEDKFLTTRAQLEDQMAMTLGGRAAEELVFSEITTGAANDLEKVTSTAKQMTMRFGMSDKLGPRVLGHNHGAPFLGRDMHSEPDYSDDLARTIDSEIRRIIEEAHQRARDILTEHREDLENLSQILLRRETIERTEFIALLEGRDEAEVFAERDAKAAELARESELANAPDKPKHKRLPYPGAGEPLTEA
ncbi:ATP-dependent zinc metalloprotease FtsH [Miltoncostaea oceani]|uniref:ATP-dependent zinc metalloprotease FtsH n=1 Tax=Miltoncostaea oceani TaxID=2843216 RepID=UPI001C3C6BFB|nr:ATP-dependent zinc metalloprotease FtsH [Miltoncostaea oceani]